jgi:hypothetical protein
VNIGRGAFADLILGIAEPFSQFFNLRFRWHIQTPIPELPDCSARPLVCSLR